MPEIKNYTFSHTELAEILVKHLGINEGQWGIYLEFTMFASNIPVPPDGQSALPGAVNIVQKIGIQRFAASGDAPANLTIDAAMINRPAPAEPAPPRKRH